MDLKEIVENLIDIFLTAGDMSLALRKKGLIKIRNFKNALKHTWTTIACLNDKHQPYHVYDYH